jgi:hypothetical protein
VDTSADSGAANASDVLADLPNESYFSLWGVRDNDVWALGNHVEPSDGFSGPPIESCPPNRNDAQMLVRRFDGVEWVQVPGAPNTQLRRVAGVGEEAWLIGEAGAVVRWRGGAWQAVDISEAADFKSLTFPCAALELNGLWAAAVDDIWIVGAIQDNPADNSVGPGLLLHFDGQHWRRFPTNAVDDFLDVWGSGSSDVWAVGASGVTYHYDGTTWSSVDIGTNLYHFGVWGSSSTDVWAVGNGGSIAHFDGSRWSLTASDYVELRGVWGASSTDVWAVGTCCWQAPGSKKPFVTHWDGQRWEQQPVDGRVFPEAVWASATGSVWAAGGPIARLR